MKWEGRRSTLFFSEGRGSFLGTTFYQLPSPQLDLFLHSINLKAPINTKTSRCDLEVFGSNSILEHFHRQWLSKVKIAQIIWLVATPLLVHCSAITKRANFNMPLDVALFLLKIEKWLSVIIRCAAYSVLHKISLRTVSSAKNLLPCVWCLCSSMDRARLRLDLFPHLIIC